jgi:predicted dehydrogenase
MSRVYRGAIIGFGNVAAHGHLPGWQAQPDFTIVAVADPDAARCAEAQRLLPGIRVYADYEEVLLREPIDFVDIAAPPGRHAAVIEAAARAGVPVLCEKPLTTSVAEYRRLQSVVHNAGIALHTVHNWKYSEAFCAVREVLQAGTLGSLWRISFETERNGCAATTGDNWRMDPRLGGGGILVDHGWHTFYLLLAMAQQRPRRISARLEKRRYPTAEVEDTAHCMIEFPSLKGEIRLTWAAEMRRTRWVLNGSDGDLVLDEDRLRISAAHGSSDRRLNEGLSGSSHHPEWFRGVIDEFRTALSSRNRSNLSEAALCVAMLEQAYASSRCDAQPLEIGVAEGVSREVAA